MITSPSSVASPVQAGGAGLALHNLTLGYERHPAVHHLSLAWPWGSMVAVVGPNGAGKSTLLKALAGQIVPLEGEIQGLRGKRLAYLPQTPAIDRAFPATVQELVMTGLWHEVGALRPWRSGHRQQVEQALASVGLQGFAGRTLDTLSGGQFQRALFARLILQDAEVLLLDEPFAAVDERTTEDLLALLHIWHAQGKTLVVVLHDRELVRRHFPQTLLLAREAVAWGDTAEVLSPINLGRAHGLREAFDEDAAVCDVHVHHNGDHAHAHPHEEVRG